jgi:ribosomal protein L6P/L9E
MIRIFLPKNINFICFNNSFIYLYNINIFILINIEKYSVFFNKYLNIIRLQKSEINRTLKDKNFLNNFLFTWDNFFFSKLYFLGKGFKLRKFEKNLFFNFNYSHTKFLINNKSIIKKIQKNKILVFSKDLKYLSSSVKKIVDIREISPYTKRGLRLNKQVIYKKRNKSNIQG